MHKSRVDRLGKAESSSCSQYALREYLAPGRTSCDVLGRFEYCLQECCFADLCFSGSEKRFHVFHTNSEIKVLG